MSPSWFSRITACRAWRCRSRKPAALKRSPATCGRSSCSKLPGGSTARSKGLAASEELVRRSQEGRGLTRPELAVVLSISKLVLQDAAEELRLAEDTLVEPQLFEAFPKPMRKAHADAIRAHRLRNEIVATKVANRLVNRLGPGVALI